MIYSRDSNFWELGKYRDAHLSRLQLPPQEAHKIIDWWRNPKNFLIFLGNPGCGKTYLIAALIHDCVENKKTHFRYFHEKDFYASMRAAIDKGWDYEYQIKTICETPLLFMDDIHSGQATDFQKECMLSFVDQRLISGYPTVITSNLFLRELGERYSPRFLSRMKSKENIVIELNWIDKRQQ